MTRVGIVGHSGYSGAELVRILERHPHAEPVLLHHREAAEAKPAVRARKARPAAPCTAEAVQVRNNLRSSSWPPRRKSRWS